MIPPPETPIPGPESNALHTGRLLRATPAEVFAAFAAPARLARWWGPKHFTNTFQVCEFRPGGRWVFLMHAPNGASYPNESIFREIEPDRRIVIEHVVTPHFRLTVTLAPVPGGTRLEWVQAFAEAEVANRFRAIAAPANEQNLDRLEVELARGPGPQAT